MLSDFGVDGVEPQALGSRKARLALHLLALGHGHSLRSDVPIDALWGDAPPARPEDQLAVLMSRLRSVLGRDRIEHRDGGYLLRYDWLDAVELSGLLEEILRRRFGQRGPRRQLEIAVHRRDDLKLRTATPASDRRT